jgi:HPt (histidine-containing phosphotransfer) domain-containing protein
LAALSAHIDKLHLKRCIKAGMNFVLSKPLRKTEAIHILTELIPHWQERYEKIKRTAPPLSPLKLQEKSPAYYRDRRELVDFELAKHILECGELYVWEMLHLFIQSFPDDLIHLRAAYMHKHWKHITHIAHQIRGSASYCGCTRLQDACTQLIEARKNKKETNKMLALYETLITEMESLQEYIKAESF